MNLIAFFLICFGCAAGAEDFSNGPILDGNDLRHVRISEIVDKVKPGTAVVLSEIHSLKSHHANQLRFAEELQKKFGNIVHIGFEMFDITEQNLLDDYSDKISTVGQLKSYVSMNKDWFDLYVPLLSFTQHPDLQAVALNAPRWLTSRVARVGVDQLSNFEKLMIPVDFEVGDVHYFERFKKISHIPPEKLERYFEAQSLWDDVMAETSKEFLTAFPNSILLIIVGDFHASYYGGLPKRLKKRGVSNIVTISQVSTADLNEKEQAELLNPHPRYGKRADYIWISQEAE